MNTIIEIIRKLLHNLYKYRVIAMNRKFDDKRSLAKLCPKTNNNIFNPI